MNKLKKLILIIKTGNPVEAKSAQKEIEHYYKTLDRPLAKNERKQFEIFMDEIKNFDLIKNTDNQAYFIHTLKWPFMLIGEKYFEFFAEFVLKAIQHPSGKIRQAMLKTVDWLLISNVVSLKGLGKNLNQEEINRQDTRREIFCNLVYKAETLLEQYKEPRFNRYKYISSLPVGVYKSLSYLLYENLLRSPYYENIYKKWLLGVRANFSNEGAKRGKNGFDSVFQFKVTLNYADPKIWRRIIVPRDYSFFDLHCAIQNSFGWTDSHLHGFYIAQKGTTRPIVIQFPNPEDDTYFDDEKDLDERTEKIADYFGKQVGQCQYTYDFGDSWDHTVLFERETTANPETSYPVCIDGANSCPVEDCGGVDGYERLLKIIKQPKHKEYHHMREWLGLSIGVTIDPTKLDLTDIYFEDPSRRQKEWEEGFKI